MSPAWPVRWPIRSQLAGLKRDRSYLGSFQGPKLALNRGFPAGRKLPPIGGKALPYPDSGSLPDTRLGETLAYCRINLAPMKTSILLVAILALANSLLAETDGTTCNILPQSPDFLTPAAGRPVKSDSSSNRSAGVITSRNDNAFAGKWMAPAIRLVSLASDGVSVKNWTGFQTTLAVGREARSTGNAPAKVWAVKLVTTW